jgi:hypothetical protein
MKKFFKDNWKFLLFVLLGGLIGGYFLGLYSYDSLSPEMLKQLEEQNGTKELLGISSMIQYGILFGVVLAAVGIVFSKKVNLWKKFKFDKKAVIVTIIITIIAALVLFPGDKLIFGPLNEWVNNSYNAEPTIAKIIAGFLVGGIIEEVMLRLFMMSLLSLIIKLIFCRKKKEIPVFVYVIANVISACLFALGHIPSTMTMTTLTPILIIRCMLLNGGFGLCFGYLYRKYGLGYAMISHGFTHLIADILMLIFI